MDGDTTCRMGDIREEIAMIRVETAQQAAQTQQLLVMLREQTAALNVGLAELRSTLQKVVLWLAGALIIASIGGKALEIIAKAAQ